MIHRNRRMRTPHAQLCGGEAGSRGCPYPDCPAEHGMFKFIKGCLFSVDCCLYFGYTTADPGSAFRGTELQKPGALFSPEGGSFDIVICKPRAQERAARTFLPGSGLRLRFRDKGVDACNTKVCATPGLRESAPFRSAQRRILRPTGWFSAPERSCFQLRETADQRIFKDTKRGCWRCCRQLTAKRSRPRCSAILSARRKAGAPATTVLPPSILPMHDCRSLKIRMRRHAAFSSPTHSSKPARAPSRFCRRWVSMALTSTQSRSSTIRLSRVCPRATTFSADAGQRLSRSSVS